MIRSLKGGRSAIGGGGGGGGEYKLECFNAVDNLKSFVVLQPAEML
jgi:hypothetical protein